MTKRSACAVWIAAFLCGCANVDVQTEAQSGTSPAAFTTYVQAPPPETAPDAPRYDAAMGERLQREIASLLDAKGYRRVDSDQADLAVGFELTGQPRTKIVNAGDPDVDYYESRAYVEGTLRIEIVNARTDELLWEGVGKTDYFTTGALIPTDVARAAVQTARAILEKLPPARPAP